MRGVNSTKLLTRTELPETLRSAREFDRISAFYRREGLCDHCAAYAGHRHSCGWLADPRPPCEPCKPIVSRFPKATADHRWRQHDRGRAGAPPSTTPAATLGVSGSDALWAALTGTLEGRRVFGVVTSPSTVLAEVTP